jgi:hypothetical protein
MPLAGSQSQASMVRVASAPQIVAPATALVAAPPVTVPTIVRTPSVGAIGSGSVPPNDNGCSGESIQSCMPPSAQISALRKEYPFDVIVNQVADDLFDAPPPALAAGCWALAAFKRHLNSILKSATGGVELPGKGDRAFIDALSSETTWTAFERAVKRACTNADLDEQAAIDLVTAVRLTITLRATYACPEGTLDDEEPLVKGLRQKEAELFCARHYSDATSAWDKVLVTARGGTHVASAEEGENGQSGTDTASKNSKNLQQAQIVTGRKGGRGDAVASLQGRAPNACDDSVISSLLVLESKMDQPVHSKRATVDSELDVDSTFAAQMLVAPVAGSTSKATSSPAGQQQRLRPNSASSKMSEASLSVPRYMRPRPQRNVDGGEATENHMRNGVEQYAAPSSRLLALAQPLSRAPPPDPRRLRSRDRKVSSNSARLERLASPRSRANTGRQHQQEDEQQATASIARSASLSSATKPRSATPRNENEKKPGLGAHPKTWGAGPGHERRPSLRR